MTNLESNLNRLVVAARAADAAGRINEASKLCQEALFLSPNCAPALTISGSIAARRGRREEAIDLLRRAVKADPESYNSWRWLASLLIGRQDQKEAIEAAEAAVRLEPGRPESHVLLGIALIADSRSELAIPSLQRAVELDPASAAVHHNLGIAYQQEGETEDAIDEFRLAMRLAPDMLASHLHLGKALLEGGEAEQAVECLQKARDLNPKLISVQALLADAQLVAIQGDKGLTQIQNALEQFPNEPFPHSMMGSWLQEEGRFEEADASINRSIELQPRQGFAYYLKTNNRKMRDSDRDFLGEMEGIAADKTLHPADLRYIHFALGKAYDDLKEFESAMRCLDLANNEEAILNRDVPGASPTRNAERARLFKKIFTKQLFEEVGAIGLPSAKPIIIFGMPRSGTTLLEQIVSRHSRVGAAGEQIFWRDNRRKVIDVANERLRLEAIPKTAQRYLDLLSSLAPGMDHVTEKFPSNYVNLGLLHLVFPNATFIHARRNPVDTCLSIYMRPFHSLSDAGHTRRSIVDSYRVYLEMMDHWRSVLPPGRFLEVDYEQMVSDPDNMIRKVITHCGLDWEDACLSPEAGDRRVRTFSKWQVRQPVYTTSVARWKNYEPWLGAFSELL